MRRMPAFETPAPGFKIVASSQPVAVQTGEELTRGVAMKIGEAEGIGRYVPAWTEPEEIAERDVWEGGLGCEDCVDGGVGVVY